MEQLPRLEVSLELRGDEQAVKQVHTMHNGEPTFFTQRIVKVVYCFERADYTTKTTTVCCRGLET